VQDRLATDDTKGKPVLFALNGVGRARDLEVGPDGEAHPDDLDSLAVLEAIVHDGPEVGVHTLAWCESLDSLQRRFPRNVVREFALRVVGPMAAEDSLAFVETEQADQLRPNEALFFDQEWAKLVKLRPYAMPTIDWLHRLVEQTKKR